MHSITGSKHDSLPAIHQPQPLPARWRHPAAERWAWRAAVLERAGSRATDPHRVLRLVNVVVASVALLLTAPLMLLIALAIKLTSRGPVLYSQVRVGLDRRLGRPDSRDGRRRFDYGGKLFRIYKFRTMYNGSDNGRETWAAPDDPRVTPLGRILRVFRLDELPQLVNVLQGHMSVVGPRPEQPSIFLRLREEIEGYTHRQRVPPGITGLAQVNQHYDCSIDDVRKKLEFDLEYIERRSAAEDFRIMLRTLPVVIFRQGAW